MNTKITRTLLAILATFGLTLSLGACSFDGSTVTDASTTSASQDADAARKAQEAADAKAKEEAEQKARQEAEQREAQQAREQQANEQAGKTAALTALEELPVKGRAPKTGYSRDQFGPAWSDVDHNGCDTRNDILGRDLTDKTYKANTHDCVVTSGVLNDPYTATRIDFTRGQDTSTAVQIDHVVALSNAWQTGAQQLSEESRRNLANDPYNLLAVDGPANQQKSDGDAATWLPSNHAFRCEYVARQIGVKYKYSLWVTQAEHDAMANVLNACPTQTIPADGGVETPVQVEQTEQNQQAEAPAQQQETTPAPQPTQDAAPAETAAPATPAPAPEANSDANVSYKNCAAVRAAGKAPLYRGQPGYAPKLDRDGDGIACE